MAAVISICLLPSAAELEDKQMSKVTFDYSKAAPFIGAHEVDFMKKQVMDARELLVSKTGAGNDFLGWIDLPVDYDYPYKDSDFILIDLSYESAT